MKNIQMTVEGDILTIEIDLAEDLGPSKSGRTRLVATTSGNVEVEGTKDVKIGINAYRPI